MYLLVRPGGQKYWRMKYKWEGKERTLALGVYPRISLLEARQGRDNAKKQLDDGIEPGIAKRRVKRNRIAQQENTFKTVAGEYNAIKTDVWSKNSQHRWWSGMKLHVFPVIGDVPIAEIVARDMLEMFQDIENTGKSKSMPARLKHQCGAVFRYAIVTGRAERDPTADLRGLLKSYEKKRFTTLNIEDIPLFLDAVEKARSFSVPPVMVGYRALKITMLTLVRSKELRYMEWEDLDLENAVWSIPAEKMKMRRPHVVPLSHQVVTLLEEQRVYNGKTESKWVFHSRRNPENPVDKERMIRVIARAGYRGKQTVHGFRALGMSTLKERFGYRHEVVDRQLAHAPPTAVDRAYDRAEFMEQRIIMMQEWADYLEEIQSTGEAPYKKAM